MADEDQATRSWAFMGPWWLILKAHRAHPLHEFANNVKGEISGLGVVLDPVIASKSIKKRCRALRDALELVFLLSVVDPAAFSDGLVNHVPDKSKALLKERFPTEGDGFPCHVTITQISASSVGTAILDDIGASDPPFARPCLPRRKTTALGNERCS